jgi:hypothetical protein
MSFDARIIAFAARFLSNRSYHLIVAPAVADLQFEECGGAWRRTLNRVAVLTALAGGMRDDAARACGGILLLALVPACYYIFLLVICFDVFSIALSADFLFFATLLLILSFAPVMVCFWPERGDARPGE